MAQKDRAQQLESLLGRDLRLHYAQSGGFFENADLVASVDGTRQDIDVTRSYEGLVQAIVNRLKTRRGELAPLGHPEYGSRHHELIGEPNVQRVRALIKLYVLQALRHEARIEKVLDAKVRAESEPPRGRVRIELAVAIIGVQAPLNLVVPFSLEGES